MTTETIVEQEPAAQPGLTHGEICAHLAEVYGTEVSKQTISTITVASAFSELARIV
jgi:hypothetical protein